MVSDSAGRAVILFTYKLVSLSKNKTLPALSSNFNSTFSCPTTGNPSTTPTLPFDWDLNLAFFLGNALPASVKITDALTLSCNILSQYWSLTVPFTILALVFFSLLEIISNLFRLEGPESLDFTTWPILWSLDVGCAIVIPPPYI